MATEMASAGGPQKFFSPKRKRIVSQSTSKKSNIKVSPLAFTKFNNIEGVSHPNGFLSGAQQSPDDRLTDEYEMPDYSDRQQYNDSSHQNDHNSNFPNSGTPVQLKFTPMDTREQHPFSSSSSVTHSGQFTPSNSTGNDIHSILNCAIHSENNKTESMEDLFTLRRNRLHERSSGSSLFHDEKGLGRDGVACDLWCSSPSEVGSVFSEDDGDAQDDSIERLHQSCSSAGRSLGSPLAGGGIYSGTGSHSFSGGGGKTEHIKVGGYRAQRNRQKSIGNNSSHSSMDSPQTDVSMSVCRPDDSPFLCAAPFSLSSPTRPPHGQRGGGGVDHTGMAGRMSCLSVNRRSNPTAPMHSGPATPITRISRNSSCNGDGNSNIFHQQLAQQHAVFASTDLGTPVTERGSPAVIDDIFYEHAGDEDDDDDPADRMMSMYGRGGSMTLSASPAMSVPSEQDQLLQYDLFAKGVMGARLDSSDAEDDRAKRRPHQPLFQQQEKHQRFLQQEREERTRLEQQLRLGISVNTTRDASGFHVQAEGDHTADLMMHDVSGSRDTSLDCSISDQQPVDSSSSQLMDVSLTFSEEGAATTLSRTAGGGLLSGTSAFSRRTGHRRTSSRGSYGAGTSRNSSNNSSSNNMSGLDFHSVNSSSRSNNRSTSTELPSFRPLPDQSAFDQTVGPDDSADQGGDIFASGSKFYSALASPKASTLGANSQKCFTPQQKCPATPQRTANWSVDSVTERHLARQQQKQQQQVQAQTNLSSTSSFDLSSNGMLGGGAKHALDAPFRMVRQSSLGDTKLLLAQDRDEERMIEDRSVSAADVATGGTDGGPSGCDAESFFQTQHHGKTDISFSRDFVNEGLLGSGTFADVYRVTQRNSSDTRAYAVKKSRRQFQSKRDRDWHLNEVRAMKLLGDLAPCPYVLQFVRAWQEDSYFYVQMGLAEKGTLRDLMNDLVDREQTFPDATVLRVMHDVSAGLAHIHACGMIHLDIKPANLLITAQGVVQIGDFGMATHEGSRDDGHEGDTRYMANELLNEAARLPSADIFSLGLTLYEISYSQRALEESDRAAKVSSSCSHNSHSLCLPFEGPMWHALRQGRYKLLNDRPAALTQVVYAAMSPSPADRPTAAQIVAIPEVLAAREAMDATLLGAKTVSVQNQSWGRSSSFNPAFMSNLSITTALTQLPPEEYAALMERAITPH